MTIADNELPAVVAAAQRRCPTAFARLYTDYRGPIFGYLGRYQLTAEAREDVTHDTFERAWRALPNTAPGLHWQAWLYRIATNRALDYKRRQSLKRRLLLTGVDPDTWGAIHNRAALSVDGADVAVLAGEQHAAAARLISTTLADMSSYTGRVVRLRLRGLSCRETARALNTTPAAVKSVLFRFTQRIRAEVRPDADALQVALGAAA